MGLKVLVFGVLTDVVGSSTVNVEATFDSDLLKKKLLDLYPFLANYRFQMVVNNEIIQANINLNENDEIALLPPYSGG